MTKVFEKISLHFSTADLKCQFTKICEIFSLYSPMDIRKPFGKNSVNFFEKIFVLTNHWSRECRFDEDFRNFFFYLQGRNVNPFTHQWSRGYGFGGIIKIFSFCFAAEEKKSILAKLIEKTSIFFILPYLRRFRCRFDEGIFEKTS